MMRRMVMALLGTVLMLAGCSTHKQDEPPVKAPGVIPGPAIAEILPRYNKNAEGLRQLYAPVVVRFEYTDSKGGRRTEQGEGRLQLVQPDHVALSVGKIGETYFWLGSDSQRYWWADKSVKPTAFFVGVHEKYESSQARRLGVVVAPLDLVRLLGIVPFPNDATTQYSQDRKRIGVSHLISSGYRQRTWIDSATYLPVKIEVYNTSGACELVADLSNPDGVELKGTAFKPLINRRAVISHLPSNSLITLDLSEMKDNAGKMVPETFDPEAVAKYLRAETYIDLDAPVKAKP